MEEFKLRQNKLKVVFISINEFTGGPCELPYVFETFRSILDAICLKSYINQYPEAIYALSSYFIFNIVLPLLRDSLKDLHHLQDATSGRCLQNSPCCQTYLQQPVLFLTIKHFQRAELRGSRNLRSQYIYAVCFYHFFIFSPIKIKIIIHYCEI